MVDVPQLLFDRGPGPFCSILMPTRKRIRELSQAVDSLYSLAINRDWLEFVFKIDTDDVGTLNFVESLANLLQLGQVKKIVSPRGRGYHEMHEWVNQLSELATGDWLFLFNDDARMETQNWDSILAHANRGGVWHRLNDICLVVARTLRECEVKNGEGVVVGSELRMDMGVQEFVILRRAVTKALGHFSLNPHNDNWIWSVMSMVGSAFISGPIHVRHNSEKMTDDVREQSKKAYEITAPELNTSEMLRAKIADGLKLMDYIDREVEKRDGPSSEASRQKLLRAFHGMDPQNSGLVWNEPPNVSFASGMTVPAPLWSK